MKKIILVTSCLLAAVITAFAQSTTQPTQQFPMLGSRAALRAYALSQIADVDAMLYTGFESGYDSHTWVGQKNTIDITGFIKDLKLSINVVDTTQDVYVYVAARSSTGENLFYGYNKSKPVKSNGVWTLPAEIGSVTLNMGIIGIKVDKEVSYAMIVAKDNYGNTQYYDIASSGNKIYLSGDSAGLTNAYVRISYTDGTVVSYDLGNEGKIKESYPLASQVTTIFNNVVAFKDPSAPIEVIIRSDRGAGYVPTIEVTTSFAQSYEIKVKTSDGKLPKVYWIKHGTGEWTSIAVAEPGFRQSLVFPAGITYVVPEFSLTDLAEYLYPVQTGGGGKG